MACARFSIPPLTTTSQQQEQALLQPLLDLFAGATARFRWCAIEREITKAMTSGAQRSAELCNPADFYGDAAHDWR